MITTTVRVHMRHRVATRPLKSAASVSRNLLGWKLARGKDIAGVCSGSRLPFEYQHAMYKLSALTASPLFVW